MPMSIDTSAQGGSDSRPSGLPPLPHDPHPSLANQQQQAGYDQQQMRHHLQQHMKNSLPMPPQSLPHLQPSASHLPRLQHPHLPRPPQLQPHGMPPPDMPSSMPMQMPGGQMLMVMKENPMPLSSPPQRPIAKIPEQEIHTQESVSATETPAADIESKDNGNYQEGEAEGYSVYIKGLSLHATPAQLEEEFKKYGAIKHDGIQVRSNKQGYCFGFVEFEEAIAVEKAIEASPVLIGGRQASVEEKKSTNTRATFRGRSSSGRGPGFRNEGTRGGGRGNYGNGRGYNNDRSESNGRSEFGNRGNGRGGGGYNTRREGDGF